MKLLIITIITSIFTIQSFATIIATGAKSGNYFKIGKKLNNQVFQGKAKVINTAGSVENMLLVAKGKADIAFVQSDALDMLDIFYNESNKNSDDLVDIVGHLYTEIVHVIVNKDSNFNLISDLEDTIMVSGGKQSGSSVTATYIENRHDINFKEIINTDIENGLELLRKKKIDVVFYTAKASSDLLKKYNNIKLIGREYALNDNKHIKNVTLKKNAYDFLENDLATYGVDTVIIIKKGFKDINKIIEFLNIKDYKKETINTQHKQVKFLTFPQDKLTLYTKRYGNRAILKINYYNVHIAKLQNEKLVKKLSKVNEFVNKVHFLSDEKHWKKNNYWSLPLEFFGTGYGDTEEFAMIKALFLIKLGINKDKLKLIKKNIPLLVDGEKHQEHISLAYFHKNNSEPIILDYNKNNKSIYKFKKQFKYTIIKKADNKIWNEFFKENFSKDASNKILSELKSNK